MEQKQKAKFFLSVLTLFFTLTLALRIHCSCSCRDLLVKLGGYNLEERGQVKVKGKGEMTTYWLVGK